MKIRNPLIILSMVIISLGFIERWISLLAIPVLIVVFIIDVIEIRKERIWRKEK